MGSSKDYSNVAEWTSKDTGYHTGDTVRYKNNIFRAAYWAGKEPGVDPGWSLYDELYDQTSPNPTTTAKIIGYLPTWRKDLDFGGAVMYQNITHGIIAFLNFDENNLGELDQTSAKAVTGIVQQVVTTAHKAGTFISVAIGGAVDYGFLNLLTAVGTNASDTRLDKAVQNVAQFVKDNALDGVDLDLECWWDKNGDASKDQGGRDKSKGPHPAGSALVTFAQKLKSALPGKLISATLFATSWYGNSYDPKLADYVDWLSIMSYDLTGSWNQTPVGPHTALYKIRKQDQYTAEQQGPWPTTARGPSKESTPMDDNPIFSVEDSLWYWSNPFFVNWQGEGQKVARNKLVAGVPLYGYDFAYIKDKDPESGQTPPGYKVLRYKELVQQFSGANTAANANIKVSGNTPRPSFVSASGTYPYAHNIYLETPDTAVAKLKFLNQLGLQGVIVWEMSNEVWDDGKSIVKALYQASGNPATRQALPAPSFANAPVQSGDLTGSPGGNPSPQNWMSQLPDSAKLSRLTLPGTHETCAIAHLSAGPIAECQGWSIQDQLNHGIRYLDIRCGHISDRFLIYHGIVYCGMSFSDVRDACIGFLKANPGECIVMQVKQEDPGPLVTVPNPLLNPTGSGNTRTFEQTFDWYVQDIKNYFYLDDHIPTLREARGKIVLMRRFHADDSTPRGIAAVPWGDNTTFEVSYSATNHAPVKLEVQDQYVVSTILEKDIGAKWGTILTFLDRAKSDTSDAWYINFSSGTSLGAYPNAVAGRINHRVYDYLAGAPFPNRLGTLMMDFPDDNMIGRIISLK